MSDDRSGRIRDRRRQNRERIESKVSETDETDEPSESSKPSEPSQTSKMDETHETSETAVKDELEGVYMYLPEELKQEMSVAYKRLDAEYEHRTGEELEKNREFYAALIKTGLEGLDVQDLLDG